HSSPQLYSGKRLTMKQESQLRGKIVSKRKGRDGEDDAEGSAKGQGSSRNKSGNDIDDEADSRTSSIMRGSSSNDGGKASQLQKRKPTIIDPLEGYLSKKKRKKK
ncbi:hypothetical protein HK102_011568, partial [Quaeritorhiza haematococci]